METDLICQDCQSTVDVIECQWGGKLFVLCRTCLPLAYQKWKDEDEDTYP